MLAGLLREKVVFQKPTVTINEYGEQSTVWTDAISTRARAQYSSGSRQEENNELWNPFTVTFTVRSYHKITTDMIIVWNGRKYHILSQNLDIHAQQQVLIAEVINE